MTLTPEQRELLLTRLAEAQSAYHALNTGMSARVVVDQNSERVEFTSINRMGLYNYIKQLEAQLGLLQPGCGSPGAPARFIF